MSARQHHCLARPDAALRSIVAIPVKDEAERLPACLKALTSQQTQRPDAVVVLINNSTDGSAALAHQLAHSLPVPVFITEHEFPRPQAHAGAARRMAMELAAARLTAEPHHATLLTTDADATVPPDWVAANLWCLRAGAEAVAGRAVIDPREAALIPARLHEDDARECAYAALLDELAAIVDPLPWDPWPRHTEHSGASIAVRLSAYRRAGGMPAPALGEDRHFFASLNRTDARIRHAPEIAVTVSGRVIGRAGGGMADTMRRRMLEPDAYLDEALEPAAAWLRRVTLRHAFRQAFFAGRAERPVQRRAIAAALRVKPGIVDHACLHLHCGAAWAQLEAASPMLRRHRVPVSELARQTLLASRLLLCASRGALAPVQDQADARLEHAAVLA